MSMPQIFCVDDKDYSDVKLSVAEVLQPCDTAILLPGACVSAESKTFKNVVCELNGEVESRSPQLFSPGWGHGISIVRLDTEKVNAIFSSETRKVILEEIVNSIPNELRERDVEVGPAFDDCDGKDITGWTHGFDSSSCCAGIYTADEVRTPDGGSEGTARAHRVYYAVAKAGAGRAAQEFHAKFIAEIRAGKSLDKIFDNDVDGLTVDSIRRVEDAGMRNRARILSEITKALDMDVEVQMVPDCANAATDTRRRPVLFVNSVTNSLVHVDGSSAGYSHDNKGNWRYYAGSVNGISSDGIAVCSNVSDGFILYMTNNGEYNVTVRNTALDALPFGTSKIKTVRALITQIGTLYRESKLKESVHPDSKWIRQRFGWKRYENMEWPDVEPMQLWGTHNSSNWTTSTRELSISDLRQVRLCPQAVALAGIETSKVRAVNRLISGR